MKRHFVTIASLMACLGVIWGVFAQRQRLLELREVQRQPSSRSAPSPSHGAAQKPSPGWDQPPRELLQLRAEVAQLRLRQRELSSVVDENNQLHKQVEQRQASASTNFTLPPGYKLRSQARNVGYSSPAGTFETFLWAVQNRDLNGILTALTPPSSQRFKEELDQPGEPAKVLDNFNGLAGMRVVGSTTRDDGSIDLKIEILPSFSGRQSGVLPFTFREIGGQWKMDLD